MTPRDLLEEMAGHIKDELRAIFSNKDEALQDQSDPKTQVAQLKVWKEFYSANNAFSSGQLVTQKAGANKYNFPEHGVPAIVLETGLPCQDHFINGDYVRETMLVVIRTKSGNYRRFLVDPVYFEEYEEPAAVPAVAEGPAPEASVPAVQSVN